MTSSAARPRTIGRSRVKWVDGVVIVAHRAWGELNIKVRHDSRLSPAGCGKELSMRSLATFCLAVLMITSLSPALASESETIKAINESSNALEKAAIKALMTPDHISVTPSYDGPQTTDD